MLKCSRASRPSHKIVASFMVGCTALILAGTPVTAYGEEAGGNEGDGVAVEAASSSLAPAAADASLFAGGSGTAEDPYLIATVDQLAAFRDSVNGGNNYQGKTVKLTADATLSATNWVPIGAGTRRSSGYTADSSPFAGTFDGNGHTVSGLTITETQGADYAVGFFGILENATVKDLHFADAHIAVPESELAGICAGLLVNDSTVSGVTAEGSISAKCAAGGIAGRMTVSGTISQCKNSATVTTTGGTGNAGGIVGAAYYTQPGKKMVIEGCENSAAVTGANAVGGIVGLSSSFVSGCTNSGAVTAKTYGVGGIVGDQKNYGAVETSKNSGTITLQASNGYGCGGIVGWARYDGAASAYAATAPIDVTNNENSGTIEGGNDGGGIVGTFYSSGTVMGNQNTAPSIKGTSFVGGIVGNLQQQDTYPAGVSVPLAITVANNVSTTPESAISGSMKGTYAYNNNPNVFTVKDNGTAWQATADGQRYVTPALAAAAAQDGATVSLVADVPQSETVKVDGGRSLNFDLNGFDLQFLPEACFMVSDGRLTVTGSGTVSAAAPAQGKEPTPLFSVKPEADKTTVVQLKGGDYSQDVAAYAAPAYAELVPAAKSEGGQRFLILPQKEAEAQAKARVRGADGTTVYYENKAAADEAVANQPGAVEEPLNAQTGDDSTDTHATDGAKTSDEDADGSKAPDEEKRAADQNGTGRAANGSRHGYTGTAYSRSAGLPKTADELTYLLMTSAVGVAAAAVMAAAAVRRLRTRQR